MPRRGHGEGHIRKRSDRDAWEGQLSLGDGTLKSVYGKTRQEVQQKLARMRHDLERGLPLADERQTVKRYLESWLETIEPTLGEGTWHRHGEYVALHIIPEVGAVKLAQLTPQRVQQLYAAKLAEGLSPTTVHHLHETLHKALAAAVRLGLVARNVTELVDVPRMARHEMTPLSREETQRLLAAAAAEGDRLEALWVLAVSTGMRRGELLGLRWRDVDLEHATLHVRANLQRSRKTGEWVWKEPKTRKSRRQIALSEQAVEALRAQRRRQHEERLLVGPAWEDHDLVFANAVGGPLDAAGVYHHFLRLCQRHKLPRVRVHDLRHTCATLLLSARVNPKVVSEMLGHSSVAVTLDIYSHCIPDMQSDAAAVMGQLLWSVS
jgi:integrase